MSNTSQDLVYNKDNGAKPLYRYTITHYLKQRLFPPAHVNLTHRDAIITSRVQALQYYLRSFKLADTDVLAISKDFAIYSTELLQAVPMNGRMWPLNMFSRETIDRVTMSPDLIPVERGSRDHVERIKARERKERTARKLAESKER